MNVNNDLQGMQSVLAGQSVEKAQGGRAAQAASQAGNSADEATLSAAASAAAQASPDSDVRMDKVNQVRQALDAGTYNVPSAAVADKMMTQMMGKG